MSSHRPPRLAEILIALVTIADDRAIVVGDLHEEFTTLADNSGLRAARRWYWRQTLTSLRPSLRRRYQRRASHFPPSRIPVMQTLWQDVRVGWRELERRRMWTAVAVGSLAIGVALSSTVYVLLDAAALRPLPVEDPDRLAVVLSQREGGVNHNFSYPDFTDYRAGQRTFVDLIASSPWSVNVRAPSGAVVVQGEMVSGTYFPALGIRMRAGRGLAASDVAPDARPVAVVHDALWQVLAGPDARFDGRTVLLNGQEFSVVGIVEPRFHGIEIGRDIRLWVPLTQMPALDTAGRRLVSERTISWLTILGRLRPDVTLEAAAADLNRVESVLKPAVARVENRTLLTVPGRQGDSFLAARSAPVLQLLLGAAVLVLVVGVANVASLLVSRTFERQRELAVRSALGASRLRLVRLQMTETLLIGLAAGAAALVLTQWAAQLSAPLLLAEGDALALEVGLGWPMAGFVFGLALAAIAAASLAVVATGSRGPLWVSLGDGGRGASSGPMRHRVRRGLVVVQFAVSLALVVSAALLVRTVFNVIAIPTGLNIDRVALLGVDPRAAGFDAARSRQYVAEAERRLRLVPGVRAAGYAFVPPLGFGGSRATIAVPGYTPAPGEDLEINFNIVSPGYFEALGITLSDGRPFLESDATTGPIAVVVNETMARRYWPDGRAVGRAFAFVGATGAGFEVAGVARDVKYRTIREESMPSFYYSMHRTARLSSGVFNVSTAGDPDSALDDVRRALNAVDPAVPVTFAHTLREQRNRNLANERLAMTIGAVLGGAALLMAAVGLFAAMSHAVGRRTREIGVRMALGAVPSGVARLVLGEGARLVAAGAIGGLGLAFWLGQLVKERLYGVSPYDPLSLLVAAGILAGVTLLAAWAPARRAARVDPTVALRD